MKPKVIKSFRFSEQVIGIINQLKEKYRIESDSEAIRKIILEHNQKENQCESKDSEYKKLIETKDNEIKALYTKIGELQAKLEICQQKIN